MDSKSLRYICVYVRVRVFILQPCHSSQEVPKHMDIFKSFWGLTSLKSSIQKYIAALGPKEDIFLIFFHVIPCE